MSSSDSDNTLDSLTYLHQSNHFIIPNNSTLALFFNLPYRLGLSFSDATKLQYKQAVGADGFHSSFQPFFDIIGYFFSSYSVACFITALLLNRFIMMSSVRTNASSMILPKWSNILLHVTAIIPLISIILQCLCQVWILHISEPFDLEPFLTRSFTVFAWSHCVETFVTITTNTKPLEEADYTIFELSIQFYLMSLSYGKTEIKLEHISDCLMALVGRIVIHLVEIFNMRNYRLLINSTLTILHLGFLTYVVVTIGISAIPFSTFFRHFPKVFSIILIGMSVCCYALACGVRKDPFGNRSRNSDELKYYSFMNNWWGHLNCTGEQEFSVVVSKLALLLCNNTDSAKSGVQKEFPDLNVPISIHHSYLISNYNNELPSKMNTQELYIMGDDSNSCISNSSATRYKGKITTTFQLLKGFFNLLIQSIQSGKKLQTDASGELRNKKYSNAQDYNEYITESNYAKFLSKSGAKEEHSMEVLLLPDEDLSEDYIPIESENEDNQSDEDIDDFCFVEDLISDSEESKENKDNDEYLKNELMEIVLPDSINNSREDISWLMSMWNLFQCEMKEGRRLTRSQYGKLNSQGIITEVESENISEKTSTRRDSSAINVEQDEFLETLCVVCKTNDRNIVLWPCRCFALCEDCRISLGLRGFNTCICCRGDIHGYSRLHRV